MSPLLFDSCHSLVAVSHPLINAEADTWRFVAVLEGVALLVLLIVCLCRSLPLPDQEDQPPC